MSEYFNFHKNNNPNPHYFLSEELLIPNMNHCDSQRLNMFSNHINQYVHLVTPEYPKVFTNFETQIGEYSVAKKKAKKNFKIIDKIIKNQYVYDYIIQYDDGTYDIIHNKEAYSITEDYGCKLNDCLKDKNIGDDIEKGSMIIKSPNYDDDGNFMYGVNLKTVYLPYKGLTYEDGIVLSESAAKKMSSYKVEETIVSINTNDVLINLYGDKNHFKSFPNIGEYTKDKILVASRRIDASKILYNFQSSKMNKIDQHNDTVYYTNGGKIVDIEIFSNETVESLRKRDNEFSNSIADVLENQNRYNKELAEALEKIIPCRDKTKTKVVRNNKECIEAEFEKTHFGFSPAAPIPRDENPNKYTDELGYYWKKSHESLDPRIKWRHDNKVFDNFKIKFTILKEAPLVEGCKITGRYGNKSVVALIEKDERMPRTVDGEIAEVCANPLGVINRNNLGQLTEQYINNITRKLQKLLKTFDNLSDKEKEYFSTLDLINPKQKEFELEEYNKLTEDEKVEYFKDLEENGIYIHQPPFFGNMKLEDQVKMLKEKPYLCSECEFENIARPLQFGELYYMRLKHEPANKSSVRSTNFTNVKRLPSKSTLKKEKKILLSSTPIRLGEMEVTNLMMAKQPDVVNKILRTYSTSEKDRIKLVEDLLTSEDPFDINTTISEEPTITRNILNKSLNILELDLED